MTPTTTTRTTARLGDPLAAERPADEVLEPLGRRRRPGVSRTSSAQPAQTNDIASVTTMSGTRVSDDERRR